jgi:hypothetical protein
MIPMPGEYWKAVGSLIGKDQSNALLTIALASGCSEKRSALAAMRITSFGW